LTRTDTSGDQAFFQMAGGSGVRVEPDLLKDFSDQTTAQAQAFQTAFSNGVMPLMPQAAQVGGSTREAAALANRHADVLNQMQLFARDAGIGLTALGMGAQTIAVNYLDSDATQAASMAQVTDAFFPEPGEQSLRDLSIGAADSAVDVTDEDQAAADRIEAALPAPDDMTPDESSYTPVDPRAADQDIALGSGGDEYVVRADDDIETRSYEDAYRLEQQRVEAGDDYDPTEH
jgi:hypothetical protein